MGSGLFNQGREISFAELQEPQSTTLQRGGEVGGSGYVVGSRSHIWEEKESCGEGDPEIIINSKV